MTSKTEDLEVTQEPNTVVALFRRVFTDSATLACEFDDVDAEFLKPHGISLPKTSQRMSDDEVNVEKEISLTIEDVVIQHDGLNIVDRLYPHRSPGWDDAIHPPHNFFDDEKHTLIKPCEPVEKIDESPKEKEVDDSLLNPEISLPIYKPTMNF